jgi:hypothetical protein
LYLVVFLTTEKKPLLPFSKQVNFSFFLFFLADDIVLWHDPLCMWVHSSMYWLVYHVLLFATSSALYCEGLSSTKAAYLLHFCIRKKGHKKRENWQTRHRSKYYWHREKRERGRERKRSQLNTYVHMPVSFVLCLSFSIRLYLH